MCGSAFPVTTHSLLWYLYLISSQAISIANSDNTLDQKVMFGMWNDYLNIYYCLLIIILFMLFEIFSVKCKLDYPNTTAISSVLIPTHPHLHQIKYYFTPPPTNTHPPTTTLTYPPRCTTFLCIPTVIYRYNVHQHDVLEFVSIPSKLNLNVENIRLKWETMNAL